MTSHARILANRLNARKSTGPRSPEGKAVVARNPIKHGLLARQDVISSESQAEFDLYRTLILADLAPATPMESMLAERIVTLSWRLRRTARIHNETIDALLKVRKEFSAWAEGVCGWVEERRMLARSEGRYGIASEYKQEGKMAEEARSVLVRIVDDELKKISRANQPMPG